MIVANCSPLIIFGKQGRLDLLKCCFRQVRIPSAVYDEIMKKSESPEARAIEKARTEGWLRIEPVSVSTFLETTKIGKGEKEAITLAQKQECMLLVDDDGAKSYASLLGVEAHGSLFVLFYSVKKKHCTRQEVQQLLEAMLKNGMYLSTITYARFLELLQKEH